VPEWMEGVRGSALLAEGACQRDRGGRGGMADAEDLKSSPGEPGCGFESHRRYCDSGRTDASNPVASEGYATSTPDHAVPSSRQQATDGGPTRLPRATVCATTQSEVADPELDELVSRWTAMTPEQRHRIMAVARGE